MMKGETRLRAEWRTGKLTRGAYAFIKPARTFNDLEPRERNHVLAAYRRATTADANNEHAYALQEYICNGTIHSGRAVNRKRDELANTPDAE